MKRLSFILALLVSWPAWAQVVSNPANNFTTPTITGTVTGTYTLGGTPTITGLVSLNGITTITGSDLGSGGSLFIGNEQTSGTITGTEDVFIGTRAGTAFTGVSAFDVCVGHNACGNGGGTPFAGSSNTAVGTDAARSVKASGFTVFGAGALKTQTNASGGQFTAFGVAALGNLDSANSNNNSAAFGLNACRGATGSQTFRGATCLGSNTGGALTTAVGVTVIGQGVGNSTLASASGVLLIGSGNVTVDQNTSNSINIENVLTWTGTNTASTSVPTIHGTPTLPDITTGTNADVLCVDSGNIVRLQAAASCTISSMRFKRDIEPVAQDRSLRTIMGLRTTTFYRLGQEDNPDRNAARQQIGLIAENVAQVEPRLAIYEPDMFTVKSWHLDGMIAELVGAVQEQQREIDGLRRYMGVGR